MAVSKTFSPAERRNWGYWDGVSDRRRGKRAPWVLSYVYRCKHPFDRPYGEAYWAGYYGEPHPNTGEVPAEAA